VNFCGAANAVGSTTTNAITTAGAAMMAMVAKVSTAVFTQDSSSRVLYKNTAGYQQRLNNN
jgi:hypothetical protein